MLLLLLSLTVITSCSTITDMLASLSGGAAAPAAAAPVAASAAAVVTASPTVIPNGAYVPAGNDNGMVVTVSNKDFLETGIKYAGKMPLIGKYEIKNSVVLVDGVATDFKWDGKTFTYKKLTFKIDPNHGEV